MMNHSSREEPIGRDVLGRLIYPGDTLVNTCDRQLATVYKALDEKDDEFRVYWFNDSGVLINGCWYDIYSEVDLDLSPKRSNYERYFADLGTLDEIKEAFIAIRCRLNDCHTCPFWKWGAAFGVRFYDLSYRFNSCLGFPHWLEQEATF